MFLKNTFVHHVHFWLKDKANKQQLIDGLETLIPIPAYPRYAYRCTCRNLSRCGRPLV